MLPNAYAQGLSGARNTGIEASTGDVVCFLDDDAAAEPSWTTHLLAPYEDPNVLGVGGAAIPTWETEAPSWWPGEFGWVVGCSYRGQPTRRAPVRNLMGCNMSVRRTVLDAVGGFDTELGRQGDNQAGCEETELCIRAHELFPDGVFLHEPAAVVHHHVPGARASWTYFRDRCLAEGASKARMSRSVGQSAALSAESSYVSRVLPTGVATNVLSTLRGDLSGVTRAAAIMAGLSLTTGSFLTTRWSPRRRAASKTPPRRPPRPPRSSPPPSPSTPSCPSCWTSTSPCPPSTHGAATCLPTPAPSAWSPAAASRSARCRSTWTATSWPQSWSAHDCGTASPLPQSCRRSATVRRRRPPAPT